MALLQKLKEHGTMDVINVFMKPPLTTKWYPRLPEESVDILNNAKIWIQT